MATSSSVGKNMRQVGYGLAISRYPQVYAAGSKKMLGANTSSKHFGGYAKVTICSLTTASPTPRMNEPPSLRTTPLMQSVWQLIPPMHNATNQPSDLPNVAIIRPTAWVLHSIKPLKSLTGTNMSVLPSRTRYTYLMPLQHLASC